jgi:hypothetical protein
MTWRASRRLIPALAAAAALAISTSGCGSTSDALDPVAQAADVTSHAGGAHLSLTMQFDASGLSVPFTMSGEGFFNYKTQEGKLALDLSELPSGAAATVPGRVRLEEVFKSSTIYIGSPLLAGKLPGGAHWMKLDLARLGQAAGFNLQQLAGGQSNPAEFLEFLRASGGPVTAVGRELVRGVATTRYRGAVDLTKVADVVPSANRAQLRAALAKLVAQTGLSSLPVDVWVDAHGLVRRLTIVLALPAGGLKLQMHMTLELFDFGPTPPVAAPSEGGVYDATRSALPPLSLGGG